MDLCETLVKKINHRATSKLESERGTLCHRLSLHVPFDVQSWRQGENLPPQQGLVIGSIGGKGAVTGLVDTGDVHCLMIGAAGVGKTAFFLYPNIEICSINLPRKLIHASGMSFICTDTKGDLFRNYAGIAKESYGYNVAVIDLRNPTRSDGNNLLHMVNKYMDIWRSDNNNLSAKEIDGETVERRHIISVYKMVQDLLAPSKLKGKNQFQLLMEKLPSDHKARWFAGSALKRADS